MRALALGADAAFAGKSFLWAVAALGDEGPDHLIDLYIDELRASLGQIGARSPAEARAATIRHPGAFVLRPKPGRQRPDAARDNVFRSCPGAIAGTQFSSKFCAGFPRSRE